MMASSTQQAPRHIAHPAHPSQALALVAETTSHVPVYCNACSFPIRGSHYNCGSFNLHIYCAGIAPLLYIHHQHHPYPDHPISLRFCPPYPNGQFICILCGRWGGRHWLYSCTVCNGFDAHLGCAIRVVQFQPHCYMSTTPGYLPYHVGTPYASWSSFSYYSGYQPYYGATPYAAWPSSFSSHLGYQPYHVAAPHASWPSASSSHLDTIGSCAWAATQLANFALAGSPFLDIGSNLWDGLQQLTQLF